MNKKPIFILGCPRSGTTLLATLLKPSTFGAPFESHFITKYFKKIDQYGDLEDRTNFNRLINDIASERYVMQWKLDIDPDTIFNSIEKHDFKSIADALCMLRSKKVGYALWGDKTPHYTLDLDILCTLFPDSKYIFIVRDGRDVALSLLEKPWGPNNVMSCAELWKRYNSDSALLERLRKGGQLLSLRYEDLLGDPENIVVRLYEFLEEPYVAEKIDPLVTNIRKGNKNKWPDRFSSSQLKVFETIAGETLKKFGYETTHAEGEVPILTRMYFTLQEKVSKFIFLVKLNVVDTIKIRFFGKDPFGE